MGLMKSLRDIPGKCWCGEPIEMHARSTSDDDLEARLVRCPLAQSEIEAWLEFERRIASANMRAGGGLPNVTMG